MRKKSFSYVIPDRHKLHTLSLDKPQYISDIRRTYKNAVYAVGQKYPLRPVNADLHRLKDLPCVHLHNNHILGISTFLLNKRIRERPQCLKLQQTKLFTSPPPVFHHMKCGTGSRTIRNKYRPGIFQVVFLISGNFIRIVLYFIY